jgi:hypothetical protein
MIMFVGISRTMGKFGKFRLGAGLRLTKNNAVWVLFILMFVYMFQACWYMMVLCFWMVYAMFYGMYWCIKKLIQAIRGKK